MVKIPARFRRVAAAFDEAVRLCESSGSEHSAASEGPGDNLSDLVASFMEKEGRGDDQELFNIDEEIKEQGDHGNEEVEVEGDLSDYESTKDTLKDLFGCNGDDEDKEKMSSEVEIVRELIGDQLDLSTDEGFKRRIMRCLRERGFDAGLCKSRWEKSGHRPAGDYCYIDINLNQNRYIIEVNLAGHFEIARSTDRFSSLLDLFPPVFVSHPEELKKVVRMMCGAMKQFMKSTEMAMPPWRRNSYMQCKWLGSYKRTTNKVRKKHNVSKPDDGSVSRSVGFVALPVGYYRCRAEFSSGAQMRVGQLAATFRNM